MGLKWVALDVKLTKDEIPILFHDETLDRTTNGHGNVADITHEELKQLEAGSWFSDGFTGIHVPTLDDAIEELINLDMGLNLQMPCPGKEKKLQKSRLITSPAFGTITASLSSQARHVSLEAAMDVANDWKRGLIIDEWQGNLKTSLNI